MRALLAERKPMTGIQIYSEMRILERKLERHKPSHILHLLLSLVTVGFWVPVWFLMSTNDAIERGRIERQLNKLTSKLLKGE